MGGRALPVCSHCGKHFTTTDGRNQHERVCVVQQYERRVP